MGSILEFQKKIEKATPVKVRQTISKIILESPQVKRAKIQEFKSGLRPDGNIIGVYRSQEYKQQKQQQNPSAGGTVDLVLSGSFTNKLFLQNPRPSEFIFNSSDNKSDDLFSKYGHDLKGMNSKTFRDVEVLFLKDEYIIGLRKLIGL